MVQILLIGTDHPLYSQELDLRRRVLLDPIGIDIEWINRQWPGFEEAAEHFVAVIDHPKGRRVVGCVCLLPGSPRAGAGKLAQMAVDPQRQGEGIGTQLVAELERRALGELGLTELVCHARSGAEGFYRDLGWQVQGDPFDEAGIKHFTMVFRARRREDQLPATR